jgi:hypothetical protein
MGAEQVVEFQAANATAPEMGKFGSRRFRSATETNAPQGIACVQRNAQRLQRRDCIWQQSFSTGFVNRRVIAVC